MATKLLDKKLTVESLAEIVYLQALEIERLRLHCEKTYLKSADFSNKAEKSEVLLYRREDGNITFKNQ